MEGQIFPSRNRLFGQLEYWNLTKGHTFSSEQMNQTVRKSFNAVIGT
ncbi:MAG: hypothetical protein AB3N10_03165 [Allomuricauda sp.]